MSKTNEVENLPIALRKLDANSLIETAISSANPQTGISRALSTHRLPVNAQARGAQVDSRKMKRVLYS